MPLPILCLSALTLAPGKPPVVDAITFDLDHTAIYVPLKGAARQLGWKYEYDEVTQLAEVNDQPVPVDFPFLGEGNQLVPLSALAQWGASVVASLPAHTDVRQGTRSLVVRVGKKRVAVDMNSQTLRAWQGERLVFESPVSTGRAGKETPNGAYKALKKDPDHVSSTYGSSMPWSVQIVGNIYIHGSNSFFDGVGSHGCIRLPLTHGNRAKWFYDWVEVGTPILVTGARPSKAATASRKTSRAQ